MSKIEELEQRLNRLDKEKAAVRHQISQQKRKTDARQRILYGVAALALADHDSDFRERLKAHLDKTVTRSEDRELLELPGLPELTKEVSL